MKLNIGNKELNIKFGYEPTLKERIISKTIKFSSTKDEDEAADIEKIEDLLLFLPELLLVGLQVYHEEYRYDYDTKEGKEEQLRKAFALVEEYMDGEDADVMKLFTDLQETLMQDGFLRSLFQREQKKIENVENIAKTVQSAENNAIPNETIV